MPRYGPSARVAIDGSGRHWREWLERAAREDRARPHSLSPPEARRHRRLRPPARRGPDADQLVHSYFPAALKLIVNSFKGFSSASRNRAQKSVAPPPLITAARSTFGPFLSVIRFETPSSITVWRSP